MNQTHKISVVVAAYNEEKFLPKCLSAIFSQDFPKDEFEVIVVDNNSTDKTAEIAKKFGARVIKEKRQGNTFAISAGMNAATGDLIAMTDADTIVSNEWLKNIAQIFSDKDIVAATGTGDIGTSSKKFNELSELTYEAFLRLNFMLGKPHVTGFNLIVRRDAFEKVGGIDETFTMSPDVDLGLRLGKVGKVVFSKNLKATTSFRRWEESPLKTLKTYLGGYIWTVWLRKPPPVGQKPVR